MRDDIVADRPWSDRDPLEALLDRQDGVISRSQALAWLTEKAIRHRVGCGRWRRVHRAVFVTYQGPLSERQQWWVAVLGVGPPALLAGLTALLAHGLRGVSSRHIQLVIPVARRVTPPVGVVVHRSDSLGDDDIHPVVRPPATYPGRSVVDAAQWARSDNEARLIIATSFQQLLVSFSDVSTSMPARLPRRSLILATAEDCAAGSHSLGELDLMGLCRRFRLPRPSRQFRRRDSSRRLRYLDACFDEWKVVVEVDGAHHADVGQMWDDTSRQNDLVLGGYVVLRYPVHLIRSRPAHVAGEIRRALVAAGWVPDHGEKRPL